MLLINALLKFISGILLVGAMLFIPAGTFTYSGAWLFMGLLFIPMLVMGAVMLAKSPELLKKRLDSKEKRAAQSGVIKLSGLMFILSFITAGLDERFSLSQVPAWLTITASVILLAAYSMYAEVMHENAYLSRTVKVQEGQKVIDTGLYGIVRHPMYTAATAMFISVPLILGSWYAFAIMLTFPALMVIRIIDEEKLLETELAGYSAYKKRVKYRLIPYIW